jgi:alpha-tectorin
MARKITALVLGFVFVGFLAGGVAYAVPSTSFITFGTAAGDARLAPNDDGSTGEISLTNPIVYFGASKSSLWVNNNGNFTFDGSLSTFTPFAFPSDREIVAAYFGDVDTRGSANISGDGIDDVYHSERTGLADRALISAMINAAFGDTFAATSAYVATWDHVGYFNSHTDLLNTFQLILATDGSDSFAIFQYLDEGMSWETGDASDGEGGFGGDEASAGFDAGDDVNFFTIPGSHAPGIANVLEDGSNVGFAGRWIFQINDTITQPPPTDEVPEPTAAALLGTGLLISVAMRRKERRGIPAASA